MSTAIMRRKKKNGSGRGNKPAPNPSIGSMLTLKRNVQVKAKAAQQQSEIADKDAEIADCDDRLDAEIATFQTEIAALQTENAALYTTIDALQTEKEALYAEITQLRELNMIMNPNLSGPVTNNTIHGWTSNNANISILDHDGRDGVVKIEDGGGFSDLWQTIYLEVNKVYRLTFDVWADNPGINTAGKPLGTSPDSNGLVYITSGDIKLDSVPFGEAEIDNFYASFLQGFAITPLDSQTWTTYTTDFLATKNKVDIHLHSEGNATAYFDNISVKRN
jgi:hypothetical protein